MKAVQAAVVHAFGQPLSIEEVPVPASSYADRSDVRAEILVANELPRRRPAWR